MKKFFVLLGLLTSISSKSPIIFSETLLYDLSRNKKFQKFQNILNKFGSLEKSCIDLFGVDCAESIKGRRQENNSGFFSASSSYCFMNNYFPKTQDVFIHLGIFSGPSSCPFMKKHVSEEQNILNMKEIFKNANKSLNKLKKYQNKQGYQEFVYDLFFFKKEEYRKLLHLIFTINENIEEIFKAKDQIKELKLFLSEVGNISDFLCLNFSLKILDGFSQLNLVESLFNYKCEEYRLDGHSIMFGDCKIYFQDEDPKKHALYKKIKIRDNILKDYALYISDFKENSSEKEKNKQNKDFKYMMDSYWTNRNDIDITVAIKDIANSSFLLFVNHVELFNEVLPDIVEDNIIYEINNRHKDCRNPLFLINILQSITTSIGTVHWDSWEINFQNQSPYSQEMLQKFQKKHQEISNFIEQKISLSGKEIKKFFTTKKKEFYHMIKDISLSLQRIFDKNSEEVQSLMNEIPVMFHFKSTKKIDKLEIMLYQDIVLEAYNRKDPTFQGMDINKNIFKEFLKKFK